MSVNGFVRPVRDGFQYEGLNVRNYNNWNSVRHGNGAVKWPRWIRYGDGSRPGGDIYDDAVVDVIWKTWSKKELTSGDISYNVSEHTDSYGRKYYTYKINYFIVEPDSSNDIVIPRVLKNAYYKGKTVDAVLEEIGDYSFSNRYLEYVRVKGYNNAGAYIPVRIGKKAFYYNWGLWSFYALKSETDAVFSEIGDEAFRNAGNLRTIDISSHYYSAKIGEAAFRNTALCMGSSEKCNLRGSWSKIGKEAFVWSSLHHFKLSDIEGMKDIGEGAFSHTHIGQDLPGADKNSVEIPASVESIGKEAFAS